MRKILIGVFFFWHALAISTFAIPMTDSVVLQTLRSTLIPPFVPYVLSLSQWQQWNLFSPDPLQRVAIYHLDAQLPTGEWTVDTMLRPNDYEWWRRSTHFKMFMNLFEPGDMHNPQVIDRLLQMHCAGRRLSSGTRLRLMMKYYLIQPPTSFIAAAKPQPWPPSTEDELIAVTVCP